MRVDFLCTPSSPRRGNDLVHSAYQGALAMGFDAKLTQASVRPDAVLVLYGLGGADRIMHAKRPKLIAFDSGYWDRKLDTEHRKYRVAFEGFHSPDWIMRGPSPEASRAMASGISAASGGGNPNGPIMVVGHGPKSNAIGAQGWASQMSKAIRAHFPERRIVYRPKPKRPLEGGIIHDAISTERIEQAMDGVSLVVCRHSNVAVDACRAGVPVVCEDGAAAAIYPRTLLEHERQPDLELRRDFLHRLAWWQWSVAECRTGDFWRWAVGALDLQ